MNSSISRRGFLALTGQGVIGGLAVVAGESLLGCRPQRLIPVEPTVSLSAAQTFTKTEWLLINAVQETMLPSVPNSPGARDVNATGYIDAALQGTDVDPSEITVIGKGIVSLSALAKKTRQQSFLELPLTTREALLREFETKKRGEEWLRLVLSYTLEAYLGDPVYGGNPDGLVWKWLDHTAGEPRPPLVEVGKRR